MKTGSPFTGHKEVSLTIAEWKNYMCTTYRRYVMHKKVLSVHGDPVVYQTRRKLEALDTCLRYADVFPSWQTKAVAIKIISLKDKLSVLLPKGTNPSYQNQKERLEELIYVAQNLTQI